MAIRIIRTEGDTVLTKRSRMVNEFDGRLHVLLDDMRQTMIDANGLGLAAPQVGVLRRAVLVAVTDPDSEEAGRMGGAVDDAGRIEDDEAFNEMIVELINPEIISKTGEQTGTEGCLSIPGKCGIVTRPSEIVVRAQDRHGLFFEMECKDITARAVCHEADHLEGRLYTEIAEKMLTKEEMDMLEKGGETQPCE